MSRSTPRRLRSVLGHLLVVIAAVCFAVEVDAQIAIFSSPNDTISVPGNTVVTTAFTMEARVWLFSGHPTGGVYSEQQNAAEDKVLAAGLPGVAGGAWTGPAYVSGIVALDVACPNRWHHVAFVRDGTEERLYLDGQLLLTRKWVAPIANSSSSPRSVGAFKYTAGGPFRPAMRGAIDFVRISDVARYVGRSFEPPTEADLVIDANTLLLFTFDEAGGSTTVFDSSPYGHHGTVGIGFAGATAPSFGESLPPSADINGDGSINGADLGLLLSAWGVCSGCPECPADLNGDGVIDGADLGLLLSAWTS